MNVRTTNACPQVSVVARTQVRDAALGELLHAARRRAGLTCLDAAALAGLPAVRIAGIEEGDGQLLFTDALPLLAAYRWDFLDFAATFLDQLNAATAAEGISK